MTSSPNPPSESEAVPFRRVVLWSLVGLVLLAGLALYFLYGDALTPMLSRGARP